MTKLYLIFIIISTFMGNARAQVPQLDMRIGSMMTSQNNKLNGLDQTDIKTIDQYKATSALERAISPDKYIMGPGDELGISIIMGENLAFSVKVTPTGDIFIPSVGLVYIAGVSLNAARVEIKKFIIENAFPNAKVSIALLNIRKFQIQVIGAVKNPGFVEISALDRLDKVVLAAGGFHPLAKEYEITINRKNGTIENVNFLNFIRSGFLISNPTFLESEIIKVPFGDVSSNSVSLRGQVDNNGYDIIEPNETLLGFLNRSINLIDNSNLQSIIITRFIGKKEQIIQVPHTDFSNFILYNGDIIDIARDDGIMVNGFVQNPGVYNYFPGYLAYNYISMAGGNTKDGSIKKMKIIRKDGTISRKSELKLKRGDVIIVERSSINTFAGSMSILQIVSSFLTIYMTYLSASSK
jgi:protein involved in polysaccharide export with SLBB domain